MFLNLRLGDEPARLFYVRRRELPGVGDEFETIDKGLDRNRPIKVRVVAIEGGVYLVELITSPGP